MEWTEESVIELIKLYKRKEIIGIQCILTKLESKMRGRNWGKKRTDPSMSAKGKWSTYCHHSDGRK
jgi:hypothetical protein